MSSNSEIAKEKNFLKRYRNNRACADRLELKLKTLDSRLTSIKSPSFSDMPHGGAPVTMEDMVAEKIELENRIDRLNAQGRKYREEILNEIDSIEDKKAVEVMELFCIGRYTLEQVADELHYSKRHVYRIYSQSIDQLARNRSMSL